MSIPGYDELRVIARNGLKVIYRARERASGQVVCLEVYGFQAHDSSGIRHLAHLRAKAEAIATLDHPNLWRILRVAECDQGMYLVRPWVEGTLLAEAIRAGRPSPAVAVEWVRQLAEAAHHAHEHGIVHCDIKPSNVRLQQHEDGRLVPLLTDFDCAVVRFLPPALQEASLSDLGGPIVGTPANMAPEQARGRRNEVDPRTDVWALGVLLFELLAGRKPFPAESPLSAIMAVLSHDPVPLHDAVPGIDANLDRICRKCLEKAQENRYASAADLADDLARHARGERPAPPPPPPTFASLLSGWMRGLWRSRTGQSS